MPPEYAQFLPFAVALLAMFVLYRRIRRNFGRQPVSPARMSIRMGLLLVVACVLAAMAMKSSQFLLAETGGAFAGIALAVWGASQTRFQRTGAQLYYLPHTYTGLAVSLLLAGRLVFRLIEMGGRMPAAGSAPHAMVSSPSTAALFFVLIGYYVCYYGLVLWKSRHMEAADLEATPAATSPPTG